MAGVYLFLLVWECSKKGGQDKHIFICLVSLLAQCCLEGFSFTRKALSVHLICMAVNSFISEEAAVGRGT